MNRHRAAVASAGNGPVSGKVGDDIIVLPNMNAEHVPAVLRARGVVAETGGPTVHLAIVSREAGLPIMILPNAATLLRLGMTVVINPKRCEILVLDQP